MAILRLSEQRVVEVFPGVRRREPTSRKAGASQLIVRDLAIEPGAEIPYHSHPNTEQTHFLVEGELECILDDRRFSISGSDLVTAPAGVKHGFANRSRSAARMVIMFPHTSPGCEFHEPGPPSEEPLPPYVRFRGDVKPWTPWDGTTRYDMINAEFGAVSTAFSELVFQPGSVAPPHYHPETEEAMYCIGGQLTAMYGGEEIPLNPGDMFVSESGVRHTVFNASNEAGVLLPIHPTVVPVRELVEWSPKTPLPTV